jgi:predicted dienelactone hydrolase
MSWLKHLGVIAAAAGPVLALPVLAAAEPTVGFQPLSIPDGAGPRIEAGVWYPSDAPATPQPLELFTPALAKAAPFICKSEPGFDRAAFHAGFDAEVVKFFEAHLSSPAP